MGRDLTKMGGAYGCDVPSVGGNLLPHNLSTSNTNKSFMIWLLYDYLFVCETIGLRHQNDSCDQH